MPVENFSHALILKEKFRFAKGSLENQNKFLKY